VERCLACEARRGGTDGWHADILHPRGFGTLEIRCHGLGLASEAPSTGVDLELLDPQPASGKITRASTTINVARR
jgi:hypothetical protein